MAMHSSTWSSWMTVRSSASSLSVTMPDVQSSLSASLRAPVAWRYALAQVPFPRDRPANSSVLSSADTRGGADRTELGAGSLPLLPVVGIEALAGALLLGAVPPLAALPGRQKTFSSRIFCDMSESSLLQMPTLSILSSGFRARITGDSHCSTGSAPGRGAGGGAGGGVAVVCRAITRSVMVCSHLAVSTFSPSGGAEPFDLASSLAFFSLMSWTEASHSTRWKKSCVKFRRDSIGAMKSRRSLSLLTSCCSCLSSSAEAAIWAPAPAGWPGSAAQELSPGLGFAYTRRPAVGRIPTTA
mmetsp:Transcript_85348/g.184170  ORF Transcript_85348/g.184170 Transcript_85348/m.184170 type:complete len:299 (+) Transcript_85348:286-1182(+)